MAHVEISEVSVVEVACIAKPPSGRVSELVLGDVACDRGVEVDALKRALFPGPLFPGTCGAARDDDDQPIEDP